MTTGSTERRKENDGKRRKKKPEGRTEQYRRSTEAEIQREENEALGGFIQVDTLPGNVIDCTPRSVKKRAARVMKALAAREAREAQKEKLSKKK